MSENKDTLLDLEAMANESLDKIEEAPDFVLPPAGEYTLNVKDAKIDKYKSKEGAAAQRLKISYEIAETISLAKTDEPPVPNGSLFSETFQGTEQGLSYFKKRIRELMGVEDVAGVTLGDMMNSVKGAQVKVRLSIRQTESNGKKFDNINIRVVKA